MRIHSLVITAEFILNGNSEMLRYIGKYFLLSAKGILMFLGVVFLLAQHLGMAPSERESLVNGINLQVLILCQRLRFELSEEENYREILENPQKLNSFVETFFLKEKKLISRWGKDYSLSFRTEGTKVFISCNSPFSLPGGPPCILVYPINLDLSSDW